MSETIGTPPASRASSAAGLSPAMRAQVARTVADAMARIQQEASTAANRAAADHVRERLRSSMDGARAAQYARRGVPALRRAFPHMPLEQIAQLLQEMAKGTGDTILPRFAYGFRLTGRCSSPNGPVNGYRATAGGPLADGLAYGCATYTPLPPGGFDFATVDGFLGEYFVPGDYAQAVESWTRVLPSGLGDKPYSVPFLESHAADEPLPDYPYPRFGMAFAGGQMGLGAFTAPIGDPHPDLAPHALQQRFERALTQAAIDAAVEDGLDPARDLSVPVRFTPPVVRETFAWSNPWDNPWFNEVVMAQDVAVTAEGVSLSPPSHQYVVPAPYSREKKLRVSTRLAPYLIIGAITESIDFTKAIWEALPKQYRKARGTRIDYMLADLYKHWRHIDWREAAYNLVENAVEDTTIGLINRQANRNTERVLGNRGVQGLGTRVNYALGNTPFNDEGAGVDQFKLLTIAQARLKLALGVERDPRDRVRLERIARGDFSSPPRR